MNKFPINIKFLILLLVWLIGAIILVFGGDKTPVIVISGAILLRSYLVEIKNIESLEGFYNTLNTVERN